jgi:hypothetical protein
VIRNEQEEAATCIFLLLLGFDNLLSLCLGSFFDFEDKNASENKNPPVLDSPIT